MDIASGLYSKLLGIPEISNLTKNLGRNILEIRYPTQEFSVSSGILRQLLTVDTS